MTIATAPSAPHLCIETSRVMSDDELLGTMNARDRENEEAPRLMRGFSYSYHPDIDGHLAGSKRAREVWWTIPLPHPRTPCCVARWFSPLSSSPLPSRRPSCRACGAN